MVNKTKWVNEIFFYFCFIFKPIKIFYFVLLFEIEKEIGNKEISINGNGLSSRDNFPKGLRGGGPCFDW